MKNFSLRFLLAVVGAMPALIYAADTSTTVQNFSQAALMGIQLAAKRGQQTGKVSAPIADCVGALKADSFYGVYEKLLQSELTEEERQATEAFFKSPTGVKYTKYGLLQIYQAVGEQAPEPLPEFSAPELADVQTFSKTPAGDKLMIKKILEQPAAMGPVGQRIKELVAQCAPPAPAAPAAPAAPPAK